MNKFAEKIFSSFNICLACSKESFNNLKKLKANNVNYFGNLKYFSNEKKEVVLGNSIIQDLNKRNELFGQYDHLRLYGMDYFDKLENSGLLVKKVQYCKKLTMDQIKKYSLIEDEIIPVCIKV